ncbi:MAG: hypothetical protein OEU93_10610 [Rubrivivax sp.]|nr:hypothetical protein [Rubrivivax sp.]
MAHEGVQGALGTADPTHRYRMRAQIVTNAARVGIAVMDVDERYVEAGGLATHGTDNVEQMRRGAVYVERILRGAKPADLPVEEPTQFRMALNLAAARSLKLAIPQSVLVRSDLVIQ